MKIKRVQMFVVVFSCFLFLFSCGGDSNNNRAEIPGWVKTHKPEEGRFSGIGSAKTESDGESILLALENAQAEIAGFMNTDVSSKVMNYSSEDSLVRIEGITKLYSYHTIDNARLEKLDKTGDGTWWCIVSIPKQAQAFFPRQKELGWFSLGDISEAPAVHSKTLTPDWFTDPGRLVPEGYTFGLGAAKLSSDKDAISLAKKRAHKFLAHLAKTEIKSTTLEGSSEDDQGGVIREYKEENVSAFSEYDHTLLQTEIVRLEKTKDGTWWALMICPLVSEKQLEAERRIQRAFELLDSQFQ